MVTSLISILVVRQNVIETDQTLIFGHGGSGIASLFNLYPMNSWDGIEHALEKGIEGIETDVQITIDNQLIQFHNEFLEKGTDCNGLVRNKSRIYRTNFMPSPTLNIHQPNS